MGRPVPPRRSRRDTRSPMTVCLVNPEAEGERVRLRVWDRDCVCVWVCVRVWVWVCDRVWVWV